MSRVVKSTETVHKWGWPGDSGERELGLTANSYKVSFGVMRTFFNETVVQLCTTGEYMKTTELYTSKW